MHTHFYAPLFIRCLKSYPGFIAPHSTFGHILHALRLSEMLFLGLIPFSYSLGPMIDGPVATINTHLRENLEKACDKIIILQY